MGDFNFLKNISTQSHFQHIHLLAIPSDWLPAVARETASKQELSRLFHLVGGWWEWMREVEQGQAFTAEYKSVMPNGWSSLASPLLRLLPAAKEKIKYTLKHECQSARAGRADVLPCATAAALGLAMDEKIN